MNDAELRAALLRTAVRMSVPLPEPIGAWDSWLWNARFDRVVPLLYHLVAENPDAVDDAQRRQLRGAQGDAMASAVMVEHHLLDVATSFDVAGIDLAVLKGVATAHLDYPDPSWRQFGDADVLVHPDAFARARRVLEGAGWRQGYALPRHHEQFTHAVTFVRQGVELDLHQRIGHRAIGLLVPPSDLLDRRVELEIAGCRVFALSAADRLIHAAIHAGTSRGTTKRLSSVADVALLAHRQADEAPSVLERSERSCVRGIVEAAVRSAYAAAALPLPGPWVEAMAQPASSRRVLVERAYLTGRHRPVLEEIAYLQLMHSWKDRILYVDGHLRVGDAYAAEHERTGLGGFLRHLWSKTRSGRAT